MPMQSWALSLVAMPALISARLGHNVKTMCDVIFRVFTVSHSCTRVHLPSLQTPIRLVHSGACPESIYWPVGHRFGGSGNGYRLRQCDAETCSGPMKYRIWQRAGWASLAVISAVLEYSGFRLGWIRSATRHRRERAAPWARNRNLSRGDWRTGAGDGANTL